MTESTGFGLARVTVQGEVDMAAVPELLDEARRSLDAAPGRLEIDLAGVTFIDSSGLGALVQIQKLANERGIAVVLTKLPAPTRRLIELTGLDQVFTIAPPE